MPVDFRRAAVLFLVALFLGACARIDHRPEVVQGEPSKSSSSRTADQPEVLEDPGPGRIRVRKGDSLYLIARRNGVSLRNLIEVNEIAAPYVIFPNQILKVPGKSVHIVQKNDSIYSIAQRFDVDMAELIRVNRIPPPYRIDEGQRLVLPVKSSTTGIAAARRPEPQPVSSPSPAARAALPRPDPEIARQPPRPPPRKTEPVRIGEPPERSSGKFLWPVRGRVIIGFGPREGGFHNDGINIAANRGTPVRAAENGIVVYSGNQLQGFGNMVLLRHSDGWMTAYAHNERLLVRRGERVRRGAIIARVGSTGNVGQPQLHFELRRGDRAVDPRQYLVRLADLGEIRTFAALAR